MIDPITTEIIRNALISCAHDMNANLIRSAYTPIIYEGKDCAVAILDEDANVLGQSLGVPLFLGTLSDCVKLTADLHGRSAFQPGDVFFMNEAYMQGTHLNDATIFAPVHWKEQLVGFAATRAHWLDVGGKDAGGSMDSRDIYQEGTRWAPVRIFERGAPRDDIIDTLARNSRFGRALLGDMYAQVAACHTGQRRLITLLDRFGYDAFIGARDEIFRQSAELERMAVAAIPNGVYFAEGCLDNDGVGDEPVPVRVRVNVRDDEMTIDLDGSAPQSPGSVNCGIVQAVSACRVAFKLLVAPDRPVDGGTFRALKVLVPKGSIFAAEEPAACQWYFTALGLLIDLVVKALSDVLLNAVAAAHYGDSSVIYVAGRDPRREGERFLSNEPTPGGWGGHAFGEGQDALINLVNGSFKDIPIEIYEQKYPVMISEYELRRDSGGPGRQRGGCGIRRVYAMRAPAQVSLWFERSETPAWGLFGGQPGAKPDVVINPGRANERHLLKANAMPVEVGATVEVRTGGGGGFGNPLEREPGHVARDVLDGYVSSAAAKDQYGVVLTSNHAVDKAATEQLRALMGRQLRV
jgi:N-methylhydantoinase B